MPSRAARSAAFENAPLVPSADANLMADMGPLLEAGGIDIESPLGDVEPEAVVEDLDDGGVSIDIVPEDALRPTPEHDSNLSEFMDETDLDSLATQVIDWVKVDEDSREEWSSMLTQGMQFLGLRMDERTFPFDGASGVYDTLILEAVLRNQAQTCAELLPAQGPAKSQIIGTPTEQTEMQSSRVADWINFYLLEGAPEWLENMEQMFLWRALCGSTFKKTYQDPILQRPVSPFITPDKLIVSYYADSEMETCPRITHILDHTFKEIRQRQLTGFYRDIELMIPDASLPDGIVQEKVDSVSGVKKPSSTSDMLVDKDFQLYEQHVDLDLAGYEHKDENGEETGLPLPYIVTVERTSRKILAIRRNWREGDDSYQKILYFTHYKLIPGLGFYGLGYAHILGNPAKAATALQRQMIDAATLEMFPGGLRVKGMRMDDNNKMVGPCEFIEIDTGGLPISSAVAPMPYKGPSEVSFNLWRAGRENAQSLGNMADISVGDGRQDAPVGTTLALLEAANRMMSATIKTAHRSLKKEFKLFAALFGQYLPEAPYPFPVPGGQSAIMRADFSDAIDVIPVSDPNITSYAQRVTRAEMMLRSALQAPQIHDLRAAYKNMYVEAGVDERKIEAILPAPKDAVPSDPLTENQNALTGKPLAVGAWQDHQAHIQAHQVLAEQVPNIQAHIAEHLAAAMRVNVEKMLGTPLPPPGTKLPPEAENQLAVLVAQALQHLQTPEGKEPTPGQIAMAEIQVEAKKVMANMKEIEARAATEAFKVTKNAQESEKDRQTRVQIELIKAQTARENRREQREQAFAQRRKFN